MSPTTAKAADTYARAVVVDDEELARDELCYLLAHEGGIDVVAQAADGPAALEVVDEVGPDILFLDVQMPGLDGFEVARRLLQQGDSPPLVVFVTAYDRHAIEAFEVNAVDYLLKPVDPSRLRQTLARLRRRLDADRTAETPAGTEQMEQLTRLMTGRSPRREQVAIKTGERFFLVQAEDIVFASLVDESITIVTGQVTGTSNYRTLDDLQARLDPEMFWRVHRSHLVNINQIKEIVPWFSRNFILRMKDPKGTEIPVSRSQTKRLRDYLKL
jgi:two-component system response regulator LytT